MAVTFGEQDYEFILNNQYYLKNIVESAILTDSLSNIAYKAEIKMVVTDDFPGIANGQAFRVSGVPLGGTTMVYLLHPGVVWEINSQNKGVKHLTATVYDKTIYLEKTEDEYLFPAGQTADQRLKQYASDWGIPLDTIPGTGVLLAPTGTGASHRGTVYSMLLSDIQETSMKGGTMYRPRITENGLRLFVIGSNTTVWVLENVEGIDQLRTLEGAITQVKVLGKETSGTKTPVLAIASAQTAQLGTLQKLVQNSKITTTAEAKAAATALLTGLLETFTVTSPDINIMRAGDAVVLNGMNLIATDVSHTLGSPGHMTVQMATSDYVRRKYYTNGNQSV
jgi:hypothetical protein